MDDYEIDSDLFNEKPKKKNSKNKGKRGELALVKLLNERFDTTRFARVVGSGNRWSQVECVSRDYVGDIVCPPNFRFTIECKNGYNELDLYTALGSKVALLDEFLDQANEDANRSGHEPLLCWKKDRHPWLAFIKTHLVEQDFEYQLRYKEWVGTGLSSVLQLPTTFFFD